MKPAILAVGLAAGLAALLLAGCRKAPAAPDLSTPKGAALTFATALERGDAETAKRASSAGGIEQDLVDAMALSVSGLQRLYASATAKFGDDAKRLIPAAGHAQLTSNLVDGTVEQNDQVATVHSKDGRESLQLKRVDGLWKVDIGVLIRGQDISRVVPILHATGLAARNVADDVDSGKCASIDDARNEIADQIAAALRGSDGNSVAATTTPIAAPATPASSRKSESGPAK